MVINSTDHGRYMYTWFNSPVGKKSKKMNLSIHKYHTCNLLNKIQGVIGWWFSLTLHFRNDTFNAFRWYTNKIQMRPPFDIFDWIERLWKFLQLEDLRESFICSRMSVWEKRDSQRERGTIINCGRRVWFVWWFG